VGFACFAPMLQSLGSESSIGDVRVTFFNMGSAFSTSSGSASDTKRVEFYYEAAAYPLNVYPSTSLRDVVAVLWRSLRLQGQCSEDDFAANVVFTNGDGEIVVWTPSSLPAGTRLNVLFARRPSPASSGTLTSRKAWLRWSVDHNRRLPHPYVLSNDNATAAVDARAEGMLVIVAEESVPPSGTHTFCVRFDRNITYMTASLLDEASVARAKSARGDYGADFTAFPSLREAMGMADVDWAFTVDMAARTYTVRDARDSHRKPATFALPGTGPVWVAASMKAPHECSVTLSASGAK